MLELFRLKEINLSEATQPAKPTNLSDALAAAQAEFTPVPKNKTAFVQTKTGGSFKYSYADIADVLKMALPILGKNGLAFSQPIRRKDGKLYLVSRLSFGKDEVFESDGLEIASHVDDPQKFGLCLTYWRRYDGCSLLGIAPDEDTDGTTDTPKEKPAAKSVTDGPKPSSGKRTPPAETRPTPAAEPEPAPANTPATTTPAEIPSSSYPSDTEVPDNDQRKAYALEAGKYVPVKAEQVLLKAALLRQTGKKEVTSVTHNEWKSFLTTLEDQKTKGTLDKFIGKPATKDADF